MSKPFYTTLRVDTAPASEPVTVQQAKQYCRIYQHGYDDLIGSLITVARTTVENYLSRALIEQTLAWTVKTIPEDTNPYGAGAAYAAELGWWFGTAGHRTDTFELPRAPVASVNLVCVLDHTGTQTALTDDCYFCDTDLDPARLAIYWWKVRELPEPPTGRIQHIWFNITCGYPTGTIPVPITQAILLLVNYLFERRGDEVTDTDIPSAIWHLLNPYKIEFFGSTP
jgi:hypothetical protein